MSDKIPPLVELRDMYAEEMENQAVTNISYWKEPNSDTPIDEQAYLDRALKNKDVVNAKLKEALAFE